MLDDSDAMRNAPVPAVSALGEADSLVFPWAVDHAAPTGVAALNPSAAGRGAAMGLRAGSLELAATEQGRLRALFSALREPILTTSPDGRVTGFNSAATKLLGGPQRIYGRSVSELLPFVNLPVDAAGDITWQGRLVESAGRAVEVEVTLTVLGGLDLPPVNVYVIHDISRHAELNRLREQLLYNVAHELRGPMSVLDNALEILGSEFGQLSDDDVEHLVGSARRTVRRLHSLMDDLLSAGAIQSGHFQVYAEGTSTSSLVGEAVDSVQILFKGRNQRVEIEMQNPDILVFADQRYARQVLTNLLSNASKYSPDREVVTVEVEAHDGHVRFAVRDRGQGIPAEQQAGLFERFYRARADTREPGIGLGLAIAKGIIDAHGGSIGVESEIGVGTTVWFTLPRAWSRA